MRLLKCLASSHCCFTSLRVQVCKTSVMPPCSICRVFQTTNYICMQLLTAFLSGVHGSSFFGSWVMSSGHPASGASSGLHPSWNASGRLIRGPPGMEGGKAMAKRMIQLDTPIWTLPHLILLIDGLSGYLGLITKLALPTVPLQSPGAGGVGAALLS